MLNQLRSLTKTWVAAIFVALLVASFAIWGVGDIFLTRTPDAVAVVGKEKVTVAELAADFERELNRSQLDRETAIQIGVPQAMLQNLIARAAAEQKLRKLGIVATEEAVARELRETEAFVDPITGQFDRDTYLSLLANARLTPARYEGDLHTDIAQAQLGAALGAGIETPDALAAVHARFLGEVRAISVVTIPPSAAGDIPEPTAEELEAFYAEHDEAFAIPPRRAISLVTLTPDDFMPDIPVDEELLRQMYEDERENLRKLEQRDIVEIAAPTEEVAAEVAERLRAGEAPDAITAALGLAPPNTYDDALPSDLLTRPLAEAAFAVAEGDVTEPVDGGISWFVARVDEVIPGAEQTFEEARPALENQIRSEGADERLFEAYDTFDGARAQGRSLEEAAVAARIPVFSYGPVTAQGAFDDGVSAQQLAAMPQVLSAAFAARSEGSVGEIQELGEEGYFALRVDKILPATTRPLADVEPQVRAQYALTKRAEALNALAETARARLAEGAAPSEAASAVGAGAQGEISELRRDQPTARVSRELLARLFASAVGDVVVAGTPDGGRVVARLDAVKPPSDIPPEELEDARILMTEALSRDFVEIYQRDLQSAYRVQTYRDQFEQAIGAPSSASPGGL